MLLVALRKESVDRNTIAPAGWRPLLASLSARRAWIEMWGGAPAPVGLMVALRKESVDRNTSCWHFSATLPPSLSARRAWIEMHNKLGTLPRCNGRSPQGERG